MTDNKTEIYMKLVNIGYRPDITIAVIAIVISNIIIGPNFHIGAPLVIVFILDKI